MIIRGIQIKKDNFNSSKDKLPLVHGSNFQPQKVQFVSKYFVNYY